MDTSRHEIVVIGPYLGGGTKDLQGEFMIPSHISNELGEVLAILLSPKT